MLGLQEKTQLTSLYIWQWETSSTWANCGWTGRRSATSNFFMRLESERWHPKEPVRSKQQSVWRETSGFTFMAPTPERKKRPS